MSSERRILLTGGPYAVPRVWPAPIGDERVKVADGAGYDHFSRTDEHLENDGEKLRLYRWCYRTLVAE